MSNIEHWELILCDLTLLPELIDDLDENSITYSLRESSFIYDLDAEDSYLSGEITHIEGTPGAGLRITVHISDVQCWGVGSQFAFPEQLIPILERSRGGLQAVYTTEGTSIGAIYSKDGEVLRKERSFESLASLIFQACFGLESPEIGG